MQDAWAPNWYHAPIPIYIEDARFQQMEYAIATLDAQVRALTVTIQSCRLVPRSSEFTVTFNNSRSYEGAFQSPRAEPDVPLALMDQAKKSVPVPSRDQTVLTQKPTVFSPVAQTPVPQRMSEHPQKPPALTISRRVAASPGVPDTQKSPSHPIIPRYLILLVKMHIHRV